MCVHDLTDLVFVVSPSQDKAVSQGLGAVSNADNSL
jgi:hypothetical protein